MIDHTLKGKEIKLPGGAAFTDKDGTIAKNITGNTKLKSAFFERRNKRADKYLKKLND